MGQSDRPGRPMKAANPRPGQGVAWARKLEKAMVLCDCPLIDPVYPAVGAVAGRLPKVTLMVRVCLPLPGVVTVRVTVWPGL
jgi:hypothetical protein